MYKITHNNKTLAITESLLYIRKHDNGCYVQTEEEHAQGIAVRSTPYNLIGREPMDDLPTVIAVEVDGGVYMEEATQNAADIAYLSMMTEVDL